MNGKQIVVVEHPGVRHEVRAALAPEGHTVIDVNACDVSRYMKEHGSLTDLLITNRMDCAGLLRHGPGVVCLWEGDAEAPDWLCRRRGCVVVRKPLGAEMLRRAVQECDASQESHTPADQQC